MVGWSDQGGVVAFSVLDVLILFIIKTNEVKAIGSSLVALTNSIGCES